MKHELFPEIIFLNSVISMPLMKLPVQSVFVQIQNKGILISPGSCLTADQLQSLPNVSDIVAPNFLHCAGVVKAKQMHGSAKLWGPPSAKIIKSEISWNEELASSSWPYGQDLEPIFIQGMPKMNEVVFYHKSSKSIIVTDLCFNLIDSTGIGSWIILSLFGTYQKFGVSRLYLKYIKDQNSFKESIQNLLDCSFENIIVSHGVNIIGEGKKKLINAFRERHLNF